MKAATSKVIASVRPSTSAWEETSITTVSAPSSTRKASSACRSVDSGVVTVVGTQSNGSPFSRKPTVPTKPVFTPSARSAASNKNVVVVLPLVPVTAHIVSASAGRP